MRVILSRCVIVDVWLKRSFYTTGCEKHIATFAIRLIKHLSSTGKHVFIPSDKMQQIRLFQYIKIQIWLRGLGNKQKKAHREKTSETTQLLFIIVEQRGLYTTGCDEHIAMFAIRLIKHFSSTGKHKHVFIPSDECDKQAIFDILKFKLGSEAWGNKQKKSHREKTSLTKGYYL